MYVEHSEFEKADMIIRVDVRSRKQKNAKHQTYMATGTDEGTDIMDLPQCVCECVEKIFVCLFS